MEKLDRQIAEVFGYPFRKPTHGTCCTCQTCGYGYDECQCGYSTDIEKAWRLVETICAKGFHWTIKTPFEPGEPFFAGFTPVGATGFNGRPDYEGDGATAEEAICRAALTYAESTKR